MSVKDKNIKKFQELEKKQKEQMEEINEQLKKKDYLLTIYQTGDELLSDGDYERQVEPRRFYVPCSLEEIPEYIESMKTPFWRHEKGLSKKEIKNYPFDDKKWGRYWDVVIEPLSKDLEEDYLKGVKQGFFEDWRRFRDGIKIS